MLETPTQHDQQVWIVERLYRICSVFRESLPYEPCIEQYESQVGSILDEEVTPAASAWIELIAQSLRTSEGFQANEYIR